MNIINNTTYPDDYRPMVAYGNITIKYYPEKLRTQAKENPKKVLPEVKTYTTPPTSFTIDHKQKFPTNKLYNAALNRATKGLHTKKHKYFYWIDSIKIISTHGNVNYPFNQNIH